MKEIRIITTYILLSILILGCMSREKRYYRDKALGLIKNDLDNSLENYGELNCLEAEIERMKFDYFGDTLVRKLINKIIIADSIVEKRNEEDMSAYRCLHIYDYPFGENERKRVEAYYKWGMTSSAKIDAIQERERLVDSILPLIEKQDTSKYGWRIVSYFKCKNRDGVFKERKYTYYMNKDCNHILFKDDSYSGSDIGFAIERYKEALDRKEHK